MSRQELAYQEEGSVVDNFMVTQGQCQKQRHFAKSEDTLEYGNGLGRWEETYMGSGLQIL